MPFDFVVEQTPSLTMLSEILRDKSRWPKGFEWDYSNCATCAMGLAERLFNIVVARDESGLAPVEIHVSGVADAFKMPHKEAKNIFVQMGLDIDGTDLFTVLSLLGRLDRWRPEDVADTIDAYLVKAQVKVAA